MEDTTSTILEEDRPLRHFKREEFMMGDKNVFHMMSSKLLRQLDQVRERAGVRMDVTSSYRDPEYNRRIGGSPGSMHLLGRAVDIASTHGAHRAKIIRAALELGLSVGIMRNAIHLDNRDVQIVFHYY